MKVLIGEEGTRKQRKKWQALTRFRLLASSQGFSFIEVEMLTGVMHQIRAHMEATRHPLVGDSLYGAGRPDPFSLGRHFLHAFQLRFRHPKSGQDLVIKSPLPQELRRVLDRLGIKL